MTVTFQRLCDDGVLAPIHRAFGELLQRLDANVHPHVLVAGVIASEQLARGHVCFDLETAPQLTFASDDAGENVRTYSDWPALTTWAKEVARSSLVSSVDTQHDGQHAERPLVFDAEHRRVYLARYWFLQQQLAGWIAERLKSEPLPIDRQRLTVDIAKLFPEQHKKSDQDQRTAVLNAVDRRFAIVTGGPGTGKTTTVAKLLAARLMQQTASASHALPGGQGVPPQQTECSDSLRIVLMAPTGKAAQRLNESLSRAAGSLKVSAAIKEQLQAVTAGTIHRLLSWTPAPPERGGPFRKGPAQPLDANIVLIDEASMVDIELMWHLFAALRPETQVILMGDRDQLASVEAGGVLSDLCGDDLDDIDHGSSKLPAAVSWLRHSHRFSSDSELGQIAAAIREGDADTVISRLKASTSDRIVWIRQENSDTVLRQVVEQAAHRYRDYLDQLSALSSGADPAQLTKLLQALANVRVLCAHRDGNSGERAMNQRLAQHFAHHNLLRPRPGSYIGQAVIITENDYRQNLFNGDVGVVVAAPQGPGLAIAFEDPAQTPSGVRLVASALAPAHRESWAMTIHKSQGSEFGAVFVVLPEFASPVLSRELLYTAVTRVKDEVDPQTTERRPGFLCLAAREDVLREAIQRAIRRTSGLRDAINARTAPPLDAPIPKKKRAAKKAMSQRAFDWE